MSSKQRDLVRWHAEMFLRAASRDTVRDPSTYRAYGVPLLDELGVAASERHELAYEPGLLEALARQVLGALDATVDRLSVAAKESGDALAVALAWVVSATAVTPSRRLIAAGIRRGSTGATGFAVDYPPMSAADKAAPAAASYVHTQPAR
ncbi:hypothetical protein ACFU5Y_04250 [Streptomyces gardneri]|uniref:hypothetical protein n=1 Tax=Streptomyces gardneri TaxID=66892 RepID=UPI0036B01164